MSRQDLDAKKTKDILIFDLETQHSFEEVGGRNYIEKLLVSVAVHLFSTNRTI